MHLVPAVNAALSMIHVDEGGQIERRKNHEQCYS